LDVSSAIAGFESNSNLTGQLHVCKAYLLFDIRKKYTRFAVKRTLISCNTTPMKNIPLPLTEDIRLQDLLSYDILDTEREKDFDDLVELAALICDCPIATISFVDKKRQWFKSKKKMACTETPRNVSFCTHTILQEGVMTIPDARKDDRFADSPIVTGELNIIFYAGAPIISSAGHKLGSICVMDNVAKKELSDVQTDALLKLAGQIGRLLELRAKNRLVMQQAAELVQAEKTITQFTISEHETERKHIAYELHENVAQTLAAIKMYLEFAEQSKDLSAHFTQKSKENITSIIQDIRNLSHSIVPSTLQNADCLEWIDAMLNGWQKTSGTNIRFSYDKNISLDEADTSLAIYRIIQLQLRLAAFYQSTDIDIRLEKNNEWVLHFDCNGEYPASAAMETALLVKNIIVRAEAVNGVLKTGKTKEGITTLRVRIPFSNPTTIKKPLTRSKSLPSS
jgi:signal transduction histidine kinase